MTSSGAWARLVARGAAFGAGFAIAAVVVVLLVRELGGLAGEIGLVASPRSEAARTTAPPPPAATAATAPAANLRVASQRIERRHGDNIVIGVLRNESDGIVRSVRVEAAWHDAGGKLIDLCGWYVGTMIAPGEDKAFKVACGGTPERPAPEAASVRLRMVEGY
ncbi:MAG: FxLYD domain-containing protein [Burkholderiales bacterium]